MSFVHLHCHTTWSLLDGAIPAERLPFAAAEKGFTAVAMTDHDALTGAVRFTKACRKAGIKPIYGAELTTDRGHLTVIARDERGYANLCRLISKAHLGNERGEPRLTVDDVIERCDGTFVLSGCTRGEVARLAAAGRMNEAVAAATRMAKAVGDGYRIEVFDHRGYGHRMLRDRLLAIAEAVGVPAVATNNVHYESSKRSVAHDVLHAIKEIAPLSATQSLRENSEYFLKSPQEMRSLFADRPDVCDETLRIAEACEFELDLGRYHFPRWGGSWAQERKPPHAILRRKCYEGAARRFGVIGDQVTERLEHELEMIVHGAAKWADDPSGFSAYFLVVADIVDHARRELGIRCACRGSAAGSLVCYVLGISDVDPVRYDLLFERFMNARREELPDIDVDVESHRRDEILTHISEAYGSEQSAMCCMVDTFRARMAIRDVGKTMGLPPDEIDVVAKAFPRIRVSSIPAALRSLPELRNSNLNTGRLARLFELCYEIDGYPRHLALHPSGVILSSPDLADRVPMQSSYGGFTMLQADKHDVEDLGLVKLDVLGVRMLSSIAHALDEVERVKGVRPDIDGLSHDDPKTFELMRSSSTIGCFQIESPGQRDLLARLQPHRFEDLIVEISLFRPGPVKSDMVNPFLQRRHGFRGQRSLPATLREILAETNGVIVYHEQLIRVIAAVTGCSLADADFVRRHLDSERPSLPGDPTSSPARSPFDPPLRATGEDNEVGRWFRRLAVANGFSAADAAELWHEVFAFASFGFCKAHAAAFALPTYLSSWLKAHHPAEFYAGLLTHDPGMYPRRLVAADARRHGIEILPVDINASSRDYRVEGRNAVRLALADIRDMSAAEVSAIETERARGGPFRSLEDLWRRCDLSRPVLENLIHIGALDTIKGSRSRRELIWQAVELCERPRPQIGTQLSLTLEEGIGQSLVGLAPYSAAEETQAEIEIVGIDARRHLMELYEPLLVKLGCLSLDELRATRNDSEVWVAGVKVSSQTPAIRSGQRIIFLTLDCTSGPLDVTVFERVQPWCSQVAFHSWLLLVKGVLRKRGGASRTYRTKAGDVALTIVAEELFDLGEIARDEASGKDVAAAVTAQRARLRHGLSIPTEQPRARLWHASGGSAGR